MSKEILMVVDAVSNEKGVEKSVIFEAIEAALCGTKTLRVPLERPVSVVVFYATAVATRSEGILFFDDIYGHDRKLQQLLEESAH